jgi:hypothetical protein
MHKTKADRRQKCTGTCETRKRLHPCGAHSNPPSRPAKNARGRRRPPEGGPTHTAKDVRWLLLSFLRATLAAVNRSDLRLRIREGVLQLVPCRQIDTQRSRRKRHSQSQLRLIAASQRKCNHGVMKSPAVQLYRRRRGHEPFVGIATRWAKPVRLAAVAASAITAVIALTPGIAQAASPNVVGQKYSAAKATLSGAGFSIVVSTTVGDRLAWPDCVVTHQEDRTEAAPENSSAAPVKQTLITLDCDAQVATAKSPGNSMGSPEGRAAAAAASSSAAAAASSSAAAATSAAATSAAATSAAPTPGG